MSHVYLWWKQHEQAIAEQERALALEPNNADYYRDLAEALVFAGRPEEAVGLVEDAMRLNPRYPATYPFTLGFAHAYLGFEDNSPEHYEQAIAALKEAIEINPNLYASHLIIAYAYHQTGQEEEARNHVAQALEINPQLSLEALRGRIPFKDQALPEALIDALRKAGMN